MQVKIIFHKKYSVKELRLPSLVSLALEVGPSDGAARVPFVGLASTKHQQTEDVVTTVRVPGNLIYEYVLVYFSFTRICTWNP